MDMQAALLAAMISRGECTVAFSNLDLNALMETQCYTMLKQIKAILEDDTLEDPACFQRIEAIMGIFEGLGIAIANRHDFG